MCSIQPFYRIHRSLFCWKTGKCSVREQGKTVEKRSGEQAVHWYFPGLGQLAMNFVFFLSFTEGEQ